MSSLDEDDGLTDEGRARQALIRASIRDRAAVVDLLAKYQATKLRDLRLRDLASFTRECEAIQVPIPPVEMTPAFAIGERVRHRHGQGRRLKVTGYQLRYVLQDDSGALMWHGAGVSAERLERVETPPAPPAPPAPIPTPVSEWDIGAALYVAVNEVSGKTGRSFAANAAALNEALAARGLRIVSK